MNGKTKIKKVSEKLTKEVYLSNDYSIFKTMDGNRNVDAKHVKSLQKLMLENGNLTAEFPVVVDANGYIIDGQHRVEALKGLGWEIGYRVEETATIETVRAINQGNRNWGWRDIAYSYATRGNEHYAWFIAFVDQYGLRFTPALAIATQIGESRTTRRVFSNGELVIQDKAKAHDIAAQIVAIQRLVQLDNGDFSHSLNMIMRSPQYDHDRMMNKLRQQGELLPIKARRTDYMRRLEEIYNFGFPEESRVRLF